MVIQKGKNMGKLPDRNIAQLAGQNQMFVEKRLFIDLRNLCNKKLPAF